MKSMSKEEVYKLLKEFFYPVQDKSRVEMENKEMNKIISDIINKVVQSDNIESSAFYAVLSLSSEFNKIFIELAIDNKKRKEKLKIISILVLVLTLILVVFHAKAYMAFTCYGLLVCLYFVAVDLVNIFENKRMDFYMLAFNIRNIQTSDLRQRSFIDILDEELLELYDAGDLNNERFKYLLGLRIMYAALDFSTCKFSDLWPTEEHLEKYKDED